MATIVNNPPATTESRDNGMTGMVIALFLIVLLILAAYFGLPVLRRVTSAPQISVPDKVNVNVNTPQK